MDEKFFIETGLLNKILAECKALDKKEWSTEDKQYFSDICFNLSEAQSDGFSRLMEAKCDFLYWFRFQNLINAYFENLTQDDNPIYVLRALKQMISKSIHIEYFALTDSLMHLVSQRWSKQEQNNWSVLTEVFTVFDELQENLTEQKTNLFFLNNLEICLNLSVFIASKTFSEILILVTENFQKCLTWLVGPKNTQSYLSMELEMRKDFNTEISHDFIEFILTSFKTLLRDRVFGYTYCPNKFFQLVNSSVVQNLVSIIKNEGSLIETKFVIHAIQILDGLSCIDLISEFKELPEKKNPYFKEACKHFNVYAQKLRQLVQVNLDDEMATELKSQKLLFNFLLFIQDMVELKTREMANSLYVQIIEPLIHLVSVQPKDSVYYVSLVCQEAALLILKTITKRSHIFDDSNQISQIIDRLKVELQILQQDLHGDRQIVSRPNDLGFCDNRLENRQKFIKDCFSFLCYSIIRMDPTQINQQQNFVAHSRKILESHLFEECLLEFVFNNNSSPPLKQYEKVVDPIFMDCIQLFTFLGNDLPQKLGELIDSGIIICILNSLDRRIPVQSNMLQVVLKFFKMLNLNAKGTEALLSTHAIERLFELGQDHRSYKIIVMPKGSNLMFDQRQLVHSFANENQEISDRIYLQCLKNIETLHTRSYEVQKEFLQMERETDSLTETQKVQLKKPYDRKMVNFEQSLEASVALLSCFCMDELEYLDNIVTYQSCVTNTIRKNQVEKQIYKILRTPIICSAADGYIYHFQESATLILMLQSGLDGFQKYLDQLQNFLKQSFQDLYTVLGTSDLNSLVTIEAKQMTDLCEAEANEEQRLCLRQFKLEDFAWIAISKIHMMIEMIIILGTLSKFHEQLGVYQHYTNFIDKILASDIGGIQCIAKLQALLNRYYANVFVDAIQAQQRRKQMLLSKFQNNMANYVWPSFVESDEPYSELEDARNIYFRYELQVVDTLLDKKAEDLTKNQLQFVLPENKGVVMTFKFYKKIKNLMTQLSANYNKRKYHFNQPLLPQQIAFNELQAGYIADQLRLIASNCQSEEFCIEQILRTTILIDRVLPELSRMLGNKWKNQISGIFLFNLLNQEQIVDVVGMILEWAIQQYNKLEEQPGKKCLFYARNIQIIIRECVQFYTSLLKLTYLCSGNLHQHLAYFKRDKSRQYTKVETQTLFPKCYIMTKNLMYQSIIIPMCSILFSPDRNCYKNWHFFTGGIAENVLKIYSSLCQGGFKDPIDFFGNSGVQMQIPDQNGMYSHIMNPRLGNDQIMMEDEEIPELIEKLVGMGFSEASAKVSLINYANDFESALDALLRGQFADAQPEDDIIMEQKEEPLADFTNALLYEDEFGQATEPKILEQICKLINQTFVLSVCSFKKQPISTKRQLIMKLFVFYKDNLEKPYKQIIQQLLSSLAVEMINKVPDWFVCCYFIQLLAWAKEDFVKSLNLFDVFQTIINQLSKQAQDLTSWISTKIVGLESDKDDLILEAYNVKLYNIHVHLSVVYFLLTDFQSQQDIASIQKLCYREEEDRSAFEEIITQQDVETIKNDVLLQQKDNQIAEPVCLILSERDRCYLTKISYESVMQIISNFQNIEYSLASALKRAITNMLGPAIKVLKQISCLNFQDFDFRSTFLKDNGLQKIFEMNILDSNFKANRSFWETDRMFDADLKLLVENIWETPRDMQKWYETLIQRQLFFQFKANFKRLYEDGKQPKDLYDYIIAGVENQEEPISKKKNTQQRKSKTLSSRDEINIPQKDLKRILKKYEELNEQSFSEFVKYYNSNIFQHQIVHFNVFLAACAKVCVIKKVAKPSIEESKTQQYDLKIMIKKQLLKDMLLDPNYNYGLPQKSKGKDTLVSRQQQEIVNQLLEIFINQTKGFRMEILRLLKNPVLSEDSMLFDNNQKLCLKKDNQERKIYFVDHAQILKCLGIIICRNNAVVGIILRHNDQKTIKFIFRNIYYLMSLHVDSQCNEIQLFLNLPWERQLHVVSFFIHLLLTNHGSTINEKAIKRELQQIFIRQLAKSLTFKPLNDSDWANSASVLQKFSSIWLIKTFCFMKSYESGQKDAFGAISQKKSKFQRLQRQHMVKQLIIQCNQLQPQNPIFQEFANFTLLESIQSASISLQKQKYFFGQTKNQCLTYCVNVITKLLRLFENSQTLGKFFKQLEKDSPIESSQNDGMSDIDLNLPIDGESSEYEYDQMSDDDGSDDGFPPSGQGIRQSISQNVVEWMSDDEEEFEDGLESGEFDEYDDEEEEEQSWDAGQIQEEPVQEIQEPVQTQISKGPPRSESSEESKNSYLDQSEENSQSWDEQEEAVEQISYQDQESSYEQQEEYESFDEDEEELYSQDEEYQEHGYDDEERIRDLQAQRRIDRRAFILSQGPIRQITINASDIQSLGQDLFDLEINQDQNNRNFFGNFSPNFQRFIQQTPQLTTEFQEIFDKNFKAQNDIGGGFVEAINQRALKIQSLKDKVKLTEGFYLLQITTFTQGPQHNQKTNSATADSSDIHKHDPNDFKGHMQQINQPNIQQPRQSKRNNPLDMEGVDPLFMESLSVIGLQNLADSHQIHQQLVNQSNPQGFEVMQDLVMYLRSQPQQRRQDILRQVQQNMCRDLPSEIFSEMRELYSTNRNEFTRILNLNSQTQQPQQELIRRRSTSPEPLPRQRGMSIDSVAISIDLHGPADHSQTQQQDKPKDKKLETIRGDQFVQNFFVILQDLNARYERDFSVVQMDRQAENILQQSLIPSLHESADSQFQKIRGTVLTAQTAFMNLDMESDQQLIQSIKILHRIPNLRICLMLSVLKQSKDEMKNAQKHCAQQILEQTYKPYESKIYFAENVAKDMMPFVNTLIGALKTTTVLQTTIDSSITEPKDNKEILEVVTPISQDPLIQQFAALIGLEEQNSIIECLIDLMLDFYQLQKENPWVIPQMQVTEIELQKEIQTHVIENLTNILKPVLKEKVALPVYKICEVFLNQSLPLQKKSLQLVSQTLQEISEVDVVFQYMENKVTEVLTLIMSNLQKRQRSEPITVDLSQKIEQIVQIFKVVSGITKLKTRNICDEELLLNVFDSAGLIVALEEQRADQNQKNSLFVYREEVRDLISLIFSLCEYNLKLIFANKTKKDIQIQTIVQQNEDDPSFQNLCETHLPPASQDFKRFKTILQFFVDNRKLINKFIQLNSNVVNQELIQVALMIPQVLDFDTKRIIWKNELKRMQHKYKSEKFSFSIRRENTLQDSFAVLNALPVKQWRGGMQVEFQGEDGVDGGGLFKEWLSNMSKEIFNEDMALFIKSASNNYYPNPKSTVQSNYIEMFTFVGKVFGKALWDYQLLDCYFVKAFYKIILSMPLSYNDLEDYDSELYKSLNWMIENQNVQDICSFFVETVEYFGEQQEIELCEGGKEMNVTDNNKHEYVQLVANYRLYKAISTQIDAFLKGLYSIIPKDLLKIFDNRELELLISGLQIIDIDDLRENTLFQNYNAQSKPVQFLFEALQEFDNLERAEFIRFVTGSSKVPVEGFRGLRGSHGIQKFTVVRIPSLTQTRLPQSHTCHNQLDLPEYKDKETTKRMLLMAIKEGKTFGFA